MRLTFNWHVVLLDDSSDLRLEAHVEHAIGFIEAEISAVIESDLSAIKEVGQSTWSSNKQVASSVEIAHLRADVSTAVDDARAHVRSVGEFSGLFVNLRSQFSSRRKDERERVDLSAAAVAAAVLVAALAWSAVEDGGKHWKKKSGCFAGTSLRARHQIAALVDDWNRVFLDRGWDGVVGKLDSFVDDVAEFAIGEAVDGSGRVLASHFGWNVVVFFKVDSRIGAFEKLLFEPLVSRKLLIRILESAIKKENKSQVSATCIQKTG